MALRWRAKPASVAALREELVGASRRNGVAGKFKYAMGVALWHWRDTYAKLHFSKAAYYRYGVLPAKYTKEAAMSRAAKTITVNGTVLRPAYSTKAYKQAKAGFPLTDDPLTFSGNTKRAILTGPFRVRGTSSSVRGSWNGSGIAWAGLHKAGLGGRGLTYINNQELDNLMNVIRREFQRLLPDKRAPSLDSIQP